MQSLGSEGSIVGSNSQHFLWSFSFHYPPKSHLLLLFSCSVMSDSFLPHRLLLTRLLRSWDFPGKNTGMSCRFLLLGIFPSQRSDLCLLHRQADSLLLSPQGALKFYKSLLKATILSLWCFGAAILVIVNVTWKVWEGPLSNNWAIRGLSSHPRLTVCWKHGFGL